MKRRSLLLSWLVVSTVTGLFSACELLPPAENGSDGLLLETDKRVYTTDDEVVLTLINASDSTYSWNLCEAILQRSESEGWIEVEEASEGYACVAERFPLEPGEERSGQHPASLDGLAPGTYRFFLRGEHDERDNWYWVDVTSDTFEIR